MSGAKVDDRNVLLVTYLFPPAGGIGVQRPLKFAKYLGDYGWNTTVLTPREIYSATEDQSLMDEIPDGVTTIRIADPMARWTRRTVTLTSSGSPAKPGAQGSSFVKRILRNVLKRLKNGLLIPDESVLWALRAAWCARKVVLHNRISCVYTTSGPNSTHLAGLLIHKFTGVAWVADFRDPWTDNLHFSATGFRRRFEHWLERKVFQRASAIITVTDSFKSLFDQKYPQWARKVQVIRNGVDASDFPMVTTPRDDAQPFTICYAGILYPRRSPATFLQALSTVLRYGQLKRTDIRVQFAGIFDYPGRSENRDLVKALGLEDVVEHLGYIPHHQVLQKLVSVDALLLIGERGNGAEMYVPGKVYEYLFSQKPILALIEDGEAARLIQEARTGIVVTPSNLTDIGNAIVRFVQAHKAGRPMRPNMDLVNGFSRQSQTRQLSDLLDSIARDQQAARATGSYPEASYWSGLMALQSSPEDDVYACIQQRDSPIRGPHQV